MQVGKETVELYRKQSIDQDNRIYNDSFTMHIILLLLYIIGMTVITAPTGRFDYENYHQHEHVIEGTLVDYQYDSLTVRVSRVWSGASEPGDRLTFYHEYTIEMEENQQGLFLADSSGKLSIHGLAGDGFFTMVGRSSPNILTVEDLQSLSSGKVPEFNQHKSAITVHFPLSSEEIEITVSPSGTDRVTETNFTRWDDRRVFGTIYNGSAYLTEFGMHRSEGEDLYLSLAGEIRSFNNGVYYFDLWPKYPAFSSIASYTSYCESGVIPVYTFRIKLDDSDPWSIGLPDDAYLLSDGREFYLTGRQRFVSRPYYQRDSDSFDMLFPVFTSSGGRSSTRNTLLRLDDLSSEPRKPILMTIIEALENGEFNGSLYYVESRDSEPVFYSGCAIDYCLLSYKIETVPDTLSSIDIDGSSLSFNKTGQALLEYNGVTYTQIEYETNPYGNDIRIHNSALFDYPDDDSTALLLHFSSIPSYSNHANTSDFLIARLIDCSLLSDSIEGRLYEVNLSDDERREIATFTLEKQ